MRWFVPLADQAVEKSSSRQPSDSMVSICSAIGTRPCPLLLNGDTATHTKTISCGPIAPLGGL